MEYLALHTGAPTVYWGDNISCIYFVGFKIITHIGKHVYIPVCILQEQYYNGDFVPKYDNSSIILEDMCTKPC